MLGYILALLVVGGLLFALASFAFGRGEEMAPVLPGGTPVELPDDRLARGDDVRAVRLSVALRGYRMDEVDWLLDRLAEQVDSRDREIARLRSVLHVEPLPAPDGPLPAPAGQPELAGPGAGSYRGDGTHPGAPAEPGYRTAGEARYAEPGYGTAGHPRPAEPGYGTTGEASSR